MSDLPDPLVPAEVDLRDFAFMPLDIVRLFGSRFHAIASDAQWRAGVTLWCKSFHQVPAASLPDDDIELCRLAELGRDVKAWRKLRDVALHGWVKCSDGRLYHNVVAEKANEAWARKLSQRERSRRGNAARWGALDHRGDELARGEGSRKERKDRPSDVPQGSPRDPSRIPQGSRNDPKGQGQGQGQGIDIPPPLRGSPPASAGRRATRKPPDDFALTPDLEAWAAEHAPHVDASAETEKFRDHTFAAARSDWPATWRNWLRKAEEDATRRAPAARVNGHDEPEWRREQRERNEAFLGPYAARRRRHETIDMEPPHGAESLLG